MLVSGQSVLTFALTWAWLVCAVDLTFISPPPIRSLHSSTVGLTFIPLHPLISSLKIHLSLFSLYTPLVTSGILDTCPMLEAYVAAFSFFSGTSSSST